MKRSNIYISTEYNRSILLAIIKSIILIIFGIKSQIILPSTSSFIVCLKKSYNSKPEIYDQIANKLNSGIIILSHKFVPSIFKKKNNNNVYFDNVKYILWSDVQLIAMTFIQNNIESNNEYDVFQHGVLNLDQKYLDQVSNLEWKNSRASRYHAWSEYERTIILTHRPDLNVKVLGEPLEAARSVFKGLGFATRGPEYLSADFLYFLKKIPPKKTVIIFFHPSYKMHLKYIFLLKCFFYNYNVSINYNKNICSKMVTLSNSMIKIINSCGAELI